METDQKQALIEYLAGFVTPARQTRIERVLAQRTRHITVIAEDFHDAHNASAILRTCEGLGIQDIHIIENFNTFKARRGAASGAIKWVTVHHYDDPAGNNTQHCLQKLRSQGYLIAATSPHVEAFPPEAIPVDQKLAILFGSEHYGTSATALETADFHLKVPMVGFIESLNVSVCAALCLYTLTQRMKALAVDWSLSDREKDDLRLDWLRYSARHSEHLEARFWAQQEQ